VGQLSGTIHPTYGSTRARACCPAAVEGRQKGRGEAQKKGRGKGKGGEPHHKPRVTQQSRSTNASSNPTCNCNARYKTKASGGTPLASTVEIHVRHFFSLARCKGGGWVMVQELNGVNSQDGGGTGASSTAIGGGERLSTRGTCQAWRA